MILRIWLSLKLFHVVAAAFIRRLVILRQSFDHAAQGCVAVDEMMF